MRALRLPPLGKKGVQLLNLTLIVAITVALFTLTVSVVPAAAGTSCDSWIDAGYCCTDGWPSWSRDVQKRYCTYCNHLGQCNSWWEYRCAYFSLC